MRSYFATERFFFVRAVSPASDDRKAPPLGQAMLDSIPPEKWAELRKRASLLRSAGRGPLSKVSAKRLARALNVHWTTVYRWHQRFREARTVSSLVARGVGFPTTKKTRLSADQERIINEVVAAARRRSTPARVVEIVAEVRRLCAAERVPAPTRRSIDRRLQRTPQVSVHRRDAAVEVRPAVAPGTFRVNQPLEVVQIDHTKADVMVVDELFRRPIGRPTLTIVMDVASRAVLAPVVSFESPSAATVAYALARACAPKADWLASLGMAIDWPMQGLPASLHLDNAPEFHSRALERGCAELGIDLVYRPRGRPHFGGHIERLIGTLMGQLRALPGATGSSTRGRKRRAPEKHAVLTLPEFEQWLVLQIGEIYHHTQHRGLAGATPFGAWQARAPVPGPASVLSEIPFVFLPAATRRVRRDGVTLNNVRYWHPVFSNWAIRRKMLLVHYDPSDLSRLYARGPKGEVLEIAYADLRNPAVSLWELKAAAAHLRKASRLAIDERRLFAAIAKQRAIVQKAQLASRRARRGEAGRAPAKPPRVKAVAPQSLPDRDAAEASQDVNKYPGEVWLDR